VKYVDKSDGRAERLNCDVTYVNFIHLCKNIFLHCSEMLINRTDARKDLTVTSHTSILFICAKIFFYTVRKQLTLCSEEEQKLDKLRFI